MVHTVGLLGANGLVGKAVLEPLVQSVKDGKINLVVLHRAGSAPKQLEGLNNVQLRVIDLEGPAADLESAVKGINTFISAISFGALPLEPNLVDALAKSKDLVTYMPSTISSTWSEEDHTDPILGGVLKFIESGWDRAKEKGVGITAIYSGIFDIYMFEYGFTGAALKQNTVWANKKQLANKIPVSTIDHIAHVFGRLATADPHSIKSTSQSIVTFWPTGQELADLYTKINDKPAQIKDFTSQDREEMQADAANFGAAKVAYFDHWESGQWEYESGGKVYDTSYSGPSIEEVARRFE